MCRRLLSLTLVSLVTAFSPNVHYTLPRTAATTSVPLAFTSPQQHARRRLPYHHVQANPVDESSSESPITYTPEEPPFSFLSEHITLEKALNGAFLFACFGYALYTILNIDHGMTRGWTQQEIAMRIPLDNWSSYEAALHEKPIMTKTVINVIIYLLGDWLSQTLFSKKHVLDFDIKRTLRNGLIGLCFGPLVHQYYEFSDAILPVEGGFTNRASKILMDQTVYLTVKCSIYISAVGLLAGEDWESVQTNVKERIGPVVLTAWKFWPLVHVITYGLIPARHRILWVNCVDLVWNAILASKAQAPEEGEDESNSSDSSAEEPAALVHCYEDADMIESALADPVSKEVVDLPVPPEEIVFEDQIFLANASSNCTNAMGVAA